jgi:uncharacterized protein YdhG (YjbR/CyaY superfamily)
MLTTQNPHQTIDEYISAFPPAIREILETIRSTIQKAAPQAEEAIKYRMPTFALKGNLVFFAAFKNHIGFYPPTKGDKKLMKALARYQGPKGSLQFPLNEPIPYTLITKIVKARIKDNLESAAAKTKKR